MVKFSGDVGQPHEHGERTAWNGNKVGALKKSQGDLWVNFKQNFVSRPFLLVARQIATIS